MASKLLMSELFLLGGGRGRGRREGMLMMCTVGAGLLIFFGITHAACLHSRYLIKLGSCFLSCLFTTDSYWVKYANVSLY